MTAKPGVGVVVQALRDSATAPPYAAAVIVLASAAVLAGCRTAANPAAIQDAQVAARVKTALVNDPELGATTIEVRVTGGTVYLTGTVRTQDEAERAAALAKSVQGVRDVQPKLQVGADSGVSGTASPRSGLPQVDEFQEGEPRLLAVGASLGWSNPRDPSLDSRVSVGPLVRLGSGRGLGPALALNWFQTTLEGASPDPDIVSRIHVRPLMGGLSYTFASPRVSVSPSIVGGIAFNSLTVPETGVAGRIAVEVDNSLVWRPGISAWFDVSRRAAVNVSAGYVVTTLQVTFLENGRLVRHGVKGDTAILHMGLAYKVF
jgi:hyperosmotically inducible protein